MTQTPSALFDSANFVVLYIRCDAFERCLRAHGLSATQLAVLLKLEEIDGAETAIQDLAELVHVQPNVVTQAANELERLGLAERRTRSGDGRSKYLLVTEKGREFLSVLDDELYSALEDLFSPEGGMRIRDVFERGLRIGARVGELWSDSFMERFPSATNLVAVTSFLRRVERELRKRHGVTLSEARVLQRLDEVNLPMRVVDLATYLRLPAATITRAASKLDQAGLVERLASRHDRKAVFFGLTDEGRLSALSIERDLNRMSDELYWGRLSESDLSVTDRIKEHTLAVIRAAELREREEFLSALESAAR
ncbi:MarR family transcriptional regulator [Eggerthella guodeyinii]|uniref:MarR family transcriptional regulator n=1 Tax=Eggerthella guodeyinii TaxID=2690837 RepID=A0A6N7RQ35_9ACTN|nr:MarR family transcriptional regulator [Eggerthella guodeyinii]MRX83117.1 MarR family transcriptional regulator [Eggerthella guodeyinii]